MEEKLPLLGITRVADLTALDSPGIPVYQAVRPGSKNLAVSQGKAVTHTGAKVSAVMESAELWHVENLEHLDSVLATAQAMSSRNRLDSRVFPWRSRASKLRCAPLPWIPARSLASGGEAWLPKALIELDFTINESLKPSLFHLSSNGLASGNCLEEAQLHGLCELIERHALFLLRRQGWRRVPLDPNSFEEPHIAEILAKIRGAGMKVAVYDITWGAGIPVVLTAVAAPDLPYVWHGSGCHPSPSIALSRALTEAVQTRLTCISGVRDDLPGNPEAEGGGCFERFAEPEARRSLRELPDLSTDTVTEDLARVASAMTRHGHEPFYVDLTRRELEIPVVATFAPGLRMALHA